jgi:AcrR family transcriptional regulator
MEASGEVDPPGLRERKKLRTRKTLQAEAIRLFEANGFAATTIGEIAAAAEVSPRTFTRYFGSKDDVVLWDEFVPTFFHHLETRPAEEPLATAFREALREGLLSFGNDDLERMQRRMRLIYNTPTLRDRGYPQVNELIARTKTVAGRRLNLATDDPRTRVLSGALVGGLVAMVEVWQESGGAITNGTFENLMRAFDLDQLLLG